MNELNGTGPVASPIDATRWPVPSATSWSITGGPCSMKSPLPARNAAIASGVERSRRNVTRAGSTPWRRSTACMQSHGVGAPPKEMMVRPTTSDQAKLGRGSRLRRKNPFRSFTAAKWTSLAPPRSTSSKLRMIPDSETSATPRRRASTVPPASAGVSGSTSSPSAAK